MRHRKLLYIALITILLILIIAVPALADAGNFSGHSSFGGSGGGGGSFSGSGLFGLFALGGMGGGAGSVIFIIIVIYFIMKAMRRGRSVSTDNTPSADFSDLMPIQTLRNLDTNFSEERMKEKIANLYVQMQEAWQSKNFESMRPYMTDALFNQFVMQLGELIRAGYTNRIERIAVLDVSLSGWRSDEVNDAVVAIVNTRINDYTVEDGSGKVVDGSPRTEKFMCYEWTLIRSKGKTSAAPAGGESTEIFRCPSCGAPLEMNQSAKCPYCGSVIRSSDFDWAISSIKGISQRNG